MNRLFFLALVAISLTSCNLLEIFSTTQPYNDCYWYIKNVTSEPVCVRGYSNDGTEPINILLDKGDSVELFFYGVDIRLDFRFDMLYNNNSYHENNYLRVEVLSEAGELLKTWPLIESEASEDRFYEESSWYFYHPNDYTYFWTFDLQPDDLLPESLEL